VSGAARTVGSWCCGGEVRLATSGATGRTWQQRFAAENGSALWQTLAQQLTARSSAEARAGATVRVCTATAASSVSTSQVVGLRDTTASLTPGAGT
jgi:hypothetical protein